MNPHPGLDPICHTASLPPNPGLVMVFPKVVRQGTEEASLVILPHGQAIQVPVHLRHHVLPRQAVLLQEEDNSIFDVKNPGSLKLRISYGCPLS
jgi:hypothetical protein